MWASHQEQEEQEVAGAEEGVGVGVGVPVTTNGWRPRGRVEHVPTRGPMVGAGQGKLGDNHRCVELPSLISPSNSPFRDAGAGAGEAAGEVGGRSFLDLNLLLAQGGASLQIGEMRRHDIMAWLATLALKLEQGE